MERLGAEGAQKSNRGGSVFFAFCAEVSLGWRTIAISSNIAASVIRARMSADGEFDLIKTAPITQKSHIQSAVSQR